MSFDKISFNHFFIEVKDIIEPRFLPFINPETQEFYKSENVYFSLTFSSGYVYLNMMIGQDKDNSAGMRAFIGNCKRAGIKMIKFGTYSKNDRMIALFRYIGAKRIKITENFYIDGDDLVEYELDVDRSRRFESKDFKKESINI